MNAEYDATLTISGNVQLKEPISDCRKSFLIIHHLWFLKWQIYHLLHQLNQQRHRQELDVQLEFSAS